MRWMNLVIVMLYLSLLSSAELGSAHDQRLSPLADSQFQALIQQHSNTHSGSTCEQEPDEPEALVMIDAVLSSARSDVDIAFYNIPWLAHRSSPDAARAPPLA